MAQAPVFGFLDRAMIAATAGLAYSTHMHQRGIPRM
jgi:hypothetical protein